MQRYVLVVRNICSVHVDYEVVYAVSDLMQRNVLVVRNIYSVYVDYELVYVYVSDLLKVVG